MMMEPARLMNHASVHTCRTHATTHARTGSGVERNK